MSTNRPPLTSGNRCGHDPRRLWLDDAFLRATPIGPLSPAIIRIERWLKACFDAPPICPLFHHQTGIRQIRSERREACLLVLLTLLRHLDPESLLIGTQQPGGRFVGLAMKDIALEAGLGLRRCERVISDLKQAGALERASWATAQSQALAVYRDFIDWLRKPGGVWPMSRLIVFGMVFDNGRRLLERCIAGLRSKKSNSVLVQIFFSRLSVGWMGFICRALKQEQEFKKEPCGHIEAPPRPLSLAG